MKKHGKLLLKYLLLFVMTVFVMGCFSVSAATKTGFVTQKGKTYYINKDGSKQKGWLELKGKKYYFDKKTGVQVRLQRTGDPILYQRSRIYGDRIYH